MNPIKPSLKTEIIPALLLLITILSAFYFYSVFPEQVPMHWNAKGEVDNYGSKEVGAFLMPVIMLGIYLLFLFIPNLDPRKDRYQQFRKVYHIFKDFIIFFMVILYFMTSFYTLGYNIDIHVWTPIIVGLLFMIIGNYLSKIKPNWFMGIRTPWTLSSEEVWRKTHQAGGKIFVIGGIIMILSIFFNEKIKIFVFMLDIIFMIVGTIVYSYLAYNKYGSKLEKDKENMIK